MPLVSVIIPAYNAEKTIQATINSVLKQTLTDLEIIVINDGSTDATEQIVSSFSDLRVQLYTYENSGVHVSRNRGIAIATGEFVAFLDSDDLWTIDKLQKQVQGLQNSPDAAVAYSWINRINESGEFIRRGGYSSVQGNVYAELLLCDFLENGSNLLIRKRALDEVGGFDSSFIAADEWDLYIRLAARYEFVLIPEPQILYRELEASRSSNFSKWTRGALSVIHKSFLEAPKELLYLKRHSIANIYKYLLFRTLETQKTDRLSHSMTALSAIVKIIQHDPIILVKPVLYKALLKVLIICILPKEYVKTLEQKYQKFLNVSTILGYLRLVP